MVKSLCVTQDSNSEMVGPTMWEMSEEQAFRGDIKGACFKPFSRRSLDSWVHLRMCRALDQRAVGWNHSMNVTGCAPFDKSDLWTVTFLFAKSKGWWWVFKNKIYRHLQLLLKCKRKGRMADERWVGMCWRQSSKMWILEPRWWVDSCSQKTFSTFLCVWNVHTMILEKTKAGKKSLNGL